MKQLYFLALLRLAFSQRSEITQTSVVTLNKKATYRDSFWLPILGSSL
jgi:hypothetical protein